MSEGSAHPEAGPAAESLSRLFHLSEGDSHKFWGVQLEGAAQTVRFGHIGTNG